ncbi:hypothetical protein [Streptomyces uncialis]|uniref:hypothetical protein n=1 Tax=Streptomyces uncialis TaxID=1048205 RepID=UPI0037A7EDE6
MSSPPGAAPAGGEPRGGHQWLTSWGTFISAIAAALGLAVSGVASCAAWRALHDGRENEVRAQASLVTTWSESHRDGDHVVHVVNRSFDAVFLWALPFRTPGGEQKIITSSLPPCTELVFGPHKIPHLRAATSGTTNGFMFYDSSGTPWERSPLGLFEAKAGTVDEILSRPGTRTTLAEIKKAGGSVKAARECRNA